jgi:5,10-methylenetetrahydromethanopterin reductase
MKFGIVFPSYVDAWKDCEVAEDKGFSHAWFYDTQLLCADVWATMALAAEHTSQLLLGTLVAVPSNRIAPVTASAAATINAIAPGRVILGIGTGFTARNTMGLPAVKLEDLREYTANVRGLLAGEDVLHREGDAERWIRLLTTDRSIGCINLDDPIEIHVAANGPKARKLAGEIGDGWITAGGLPETLAPGGEAVRAAAQAAGRSFETSSGLPFTTALSTGCILRDGEALDSKRVTDRVGAVSVVGVHAAWESAYGKGSNLGLENTATAKAYDEYIEKLAAERGSPSDRRYLDVHEGHMIYLKPGEEAFVPTAALPVLSLVGSPEQVLERAREYADAGVDNLALQVIPGMARDLIDEFSEHVISKL